MLRSDPRRGEFLQGSRAPLRIPRRGALALLALLLGACDLPTSLPRWDTQWLIPAKGITIGVIQLLPSGVTPTTDGRAFEAAIPPATLSRSLGELCGAPCAAVSGVVAPKPAFTATMEDTLRLPAEVASATLAGGTVVLSLTNGFDFDPIRPSATARGSLVVMLTSGGSTIGTLILNGATDSLPASSSLTREVALTGGPISGKIDVALTLSSPAGDPVPIGVAQSFGLTALPQALRLSDITAAVKQKPVSVAPLEMNVSDIDQSLVDRVQAGALVLNVANPFALTGTMTLDISGPGVDISRPLQIPAGSTTQKVYLSQAEMQSLLGRSGVTLNARGTVDGTQAVRMAPSQAVLIDTQLELTLGSKE